MKGIFIGGPRDGDTFAVATPPPARVKALVRTRPQDPPPEVVVVPDGEDVVERYTVATYGLFEVAGTPVHTQVHVYLPEEYLR